MILLSITVFFLPFQLCRGAFCSPVKRQEVRRVSLVSTNGVLFNHPSMLHSDCHKNCTKLFLTVGGCSFINVNTMCLGCASTKNKVAELKIDLWEY